MANRPTISLTRVQEVDYLEPLLNPNVVGFEYDKNIAERCAIKRDYFEQKHLLEKAWKQKFVYFSSHLVDGVLSFVEKSIHKHDLFGTNEAQSLFGATIDFHMRISDLDPTLDLIEKRLKKLKNLNVLRIKGNQLRKRNFLDCIEPSRQSKRVLIMIEQAELLEPSNTGSFIGHITNRILDETSPTETIMILFCFSIRIQELPYDLVNCFGRMDEICKDEKITEKIIQEELLRCPEIRMKLSYKPLNNMYDVYTGVDKTIANIVYMMNHALFEHHNLLEENPMDIGAIKNHKNDKLDGGNDHQLICDHMYYYFELLKDEGMFPQEVLAIYEELVCHDDLGQSRKFIDAVLNLKKFPDESLLRRIDSVIQLSKRYARPKNSELVPFLMKYREKLMNNTDSAEVKAELINKLLGKAKSLKNPIKNQNYTYFREADALIGASFTAVRRAPPYIRHLTDPDTYFGVVFDQVLMANAYIGANDLFNDVIDKFKQMIGLERSESFDLDYLKIKPLMKSTPKKRLTQTKIQTNSKKRQILSEDKEDGVAKALYVDVVDCMEVGCLMKLDPRAKGRSIRRLNWLCPDEE